MYRSLLLSIVLVSALCRTTVRAEDQWNPSALSDRTIEAIQRQTSVYHQCLERQLRTFDHNGFESRSASSWILKQCENQLDPIRKALLEEKVPIEVANRYLLRKRHQAARQVLQTLMFAESQQQPL
ncbi:MAG: hypothetical protein L0Y39_06590 [Methylococcaceae bacterium]|nr:hypothetical protein [Methylococcaceae bacterium]